MKTTFAEILNEALTGKTIKVFRYSAYHNKTDKRIIHYFLENNDDYYKSPDWKDVDGQQVFVEIASAGGYSIPYEGSTVVLTIKEGDTNREMALNIDDEIDVKTMFTIQD